MTSRSLHLWLALAAFSAHAQPAALPPPVLSEITATVAPPAAAAPSASAAEKAPRTRCVAGCDGASARVTWSEDALNRFEEHRDNRNQLVRLFVHPKTGAPRYEVLVGNNRSRQSFSRNGAPNPDPESQRKDGQPVWEVLKF